MGLCNSYLKKPSLEKASTDESSDRYNCGTSCMQGWRVNQEDAHNCILEFDKNTALFAVYDGHGGPEVAEYSAQKLPDFLKALSLYKDNKLKEALVEAFLGFDATLVTPEVIEVLKVLAKCGETGDGDSVTDEDEENVVDLYEEAAMPIEQVIKKYSSMLEVRSKSEKGTKAEKPKPEESTLKSEEAGCSSSSGKGSSSEPTESKKIKEQVEASSKTEDGEAVSSSSSSKNETDDSKAIAKQNGANLPDSSGDNGDNNNETKTKDEAPVEHQNGDVAAEVKGEQVTSSSPENGKVSKKGKGKAVKKTKGVQQVATKTRPKRAVQQFYQKLLTLASDSNEEDEDSEDEEDKSFVGPNEESSDDEEQVNSTLNEESSDSDDDDDEEEDDDDEEDDDNDDEYIRSVCDKPGHDSGCTAVMALLRDKDLYVANAGDSRCILSRAGKAVDMSFDHKPCDKIEKDRISTAGGWVSADGRVDGGLNLSRALGDHSYKDNKDLDAKNQRVIALPDIEHTTITAQDEFMVLACDGIWNSMTSQDVVDFVRERIEKNMQLSKICEEMFDHCLAPNTFGDGTGCDNMTAIIVQFRTGKRPLSPTSEEPACELKRTKTDDGEPTTTV